MGACAQIAVFTYAYAANRQQLLYPFSRLSVDTDDSGKLVCTLKPRCGALHTRFDDYTPRNENYRGLID